MIVGGNASKIAMRFPICLMATDNIVCSTTTGTATADAFNNCFYFQSGVIWKSQVMRADPLEVSLGIWVCLLDPVRVPPLSGWCLCVACVVCVCVLAFGFGAKFLFGVCLCGFNLVCVPTHMTQIACNSILFADMSRNIS